MESTHSSRISSGWLSRPLRCLMLLAVLAVGCPPFTVNSVHVVPTFTPPSWNQQPFATYWMVDDETIGVAWQYNVDLTDKDGHRRVCDLCHLEQCFTNPPDTSDFTAVVNAGISTFPAAQGCQAGAVAWRPGVEGSLQIAGIMTKTNGGDVLGRETMPSFIDVRLLPPGAVRRMPPRELGADVDPTGGFDHPFNVGLAADNRSWTDNFSSHLFVKSVHAVGFGPGSRIGSEHRIRSVRFGPRRCYGDTSIPASDGVDLQHCRTTLGGAPGRAERATPAYWSGDPSTRLDWIVNFDPSDGFPEPMLAAGETLGIVFEIQADGAFIPPPPPPSAARRTCLAACASRQIACLNGTSDDTDSSDHPRRRLATPSECAEGRRQCEALCPAR